MIMIDKRSRIGPLLVLNWDHFWIQKIIKTVIKKVAQFLYRFGTVFSRKPLLNWRAAPIQSEIQ